MGSLSADALVAMLQAQPAQSVITMHADGSETWDGPLAEEFHARVNIVAAGLLAEGDARSAALTGTDEEKLAQLSAQLDRCAASAFAMLLAPRAEPRVACSLSAKVDASEARCEAYRERIKAAQDDEYVMMRQSREEFRGELWPKLAVA